MSVTFSDTDTGIEYLGNTLLSTAGVKGFVSGELTRTDLFLTKTTVVDTSTSSSYTVVTINNEAFSNYYGADLQSVDFSGMGELTNIGAIAFMSNIHLTELVNFNKATKLQSIKNSAFGSCDLRLVEFGGMGELLDINSSAFASNANLFALNFGNLAQNLRIDPTAFNGCSSLRQITYQNTSFLPNLLPISGGEQHMYIQEAGFNTVLIIDFQKAGNLTSISFGEFDFQYQLTALVNFNMATKLQSIGNQAFRLCDLRSVDFGGMGELIRIDVNAFALNSNLTAIVNLNKMTKLKYIDVQAFLGCDLRSVDFDGMGELRGIKNMAFQKNKNLTAIVNLNKATKLEYLDDYVFQFCDLRSVDFDGMSKLENIYYTFRSNINLTALNFGNLAQNLVIDPTAFNGWSKKPRSRNTCQTYIFHIYIKVIISLYKINYKIIFL